MAATEMVLLTSVTERSRAKAELAADKAAAQQSLAGTERTRGREQPINAWKISARRRVLPFCSKRTIRKPKATRKNSQETRTNMRGDTRMQTIDTTLN